MLPSQDLVLSWGDDERLGGQRGEGGGETKVQASEDDSDDVGKCGEKKKVRAQGQLCFVTSRKAKVIGEEEEVGGMDGGREGIRKRSAGGLVG